MCVIIFLLSANFMANQALASSRAEQSCHKQSTDTSDQCRQDTFKSSQMEPENSQVHQNKENRNSEMAVVLYNEDSILPLHKTDRSFHFVNRDIKIKQNWSALGVAAVVWDAAIVLCQYMESSRTVVQGKSVVELGAGTGLVGMVSTFLGGKTTITDRPAVMEYLRTIVKENTTPDDVDFINVAALDWTQDLTDFGKFDVILGADIVYIEDVFDDLLRTLIYLSRTDTVIYLSCRIRYDRDINFLSKMESDFEIQEILYDSKTDVKVFKAQKR